MIDLYNVLRKNPFSMISKKRNFIRCFDASPHSYKKNSMIIRAGQKVDTIGCIVSGSVKIISESVNGDITIEAVLTSPELFGEDYACTGILHSPISVITMEDTDVIF